MHMPSRIATTWLQALALTLPGLATPARAQQPPLARFIHRTTLDNGLDIVVAENHAVPLATVLVAVRNGAFTQEPAERGLAHLYEHVLFRSYKGDPNAFGRAAGRLNATSNGFTSSEVVSYFLMRSEEHTSELQSRLHLVCRLLLEKKKTLTSPY